MQIDPYNISWESWLKKWFGLLLAAAVIVNAGALWITILEPDGALYASIAKEIAHTGDFIRLRAEGRDWLDKPHFPFWMAALSFRVLGVSTFAYKFPALLFWAAGAYYTYRFALALYGKPVAQLALLIYVSAAHLVISNNDVRAEPYLTALVIGSVYHFYRVARPSSNKWRNLIAGSLLAGCAVMTKGPFVLVTIGSGFVIDWAVAGDWRQFLDPHWWVALFLIGVFISPELYCLYVQFDLHPEKVVFGHTGVSGIRFFFWDSQFGRFFNTGPIKGSGDPLFYFHTLLWAFLPWSLLLYAAVFYRIRHWKNDHARVPGHVIPFAAALASFIMFSLSRFQLPHYLNILFPFFAIMTADWLCRLQGRPALRAASLAQNGIAVILMALPLFLCWWFHAAYYGFVLAILIVLSVAAFLLFRSGQAEPQGGGGGEIGRLQAGVGRSTWMALLAFAFVNYSFYPALMQYQAGSQAAAYLRSTESQAAARPHSTENVIPVKDSTRDVYLLSDAPKNFSFEFYSPLPLRWIPMDSLGLAFERQDSLTMFLPEAFEDSLARRGYGIGDIRRFPNFHISQLTGQFVNYKTRASTLDAYVLVRAGRPTIATHR